jgi:hypothetical protein
MDREEVAIYVHIWTQEAEDRAWATWACGKGGTLVGDSQTNRFEQIDTVNHSKRINLSFYKED